MEKEMIKLRVEGIEGRSGGGGGGTGGGGGGWWCQVRWVVGWGLADRWVTRQPTAVVRV